MSLCKFREMRLCCGLQHVLNCVLLTVFCGSTSRWRCVSITLGL